MLAMVFLPRLRARRPYLCKLSASPQGSVSVWIVAWWIANLLSSISNSAWRMVSVLLPAA
jgi:hypothetical protein